MRFEIATDPARLRTVIDADPGEYDAWPLFEQVLVSAMPYQLHPDRAAVACALVYHGHVSGEFSIDEPCSPHVGSAIRSWYQPVDVHVSDIEFVPRALAAGDATMEVLAPDAHARAANADIAFRMLDEGAGALATEREFAVVSNAGLIGHPSDPPLRRLLPAMGVAVLFAEDLFVSRFVVSLTAVDENDERMLRSLRSLLDSTGIALEVVRRL